MKQTVTLNLVFINVLAASILACSTQPKPENKQCVDEQGNVVKEENCNPGSSTYNPHHRWYYGGGLFNHGSHVSGGSFIPLVGRSYATPSQHGTNGSSLHAGSESGKTSSPSISRGGFGSSGISGGS